MRVVFWQNMLSIHQSAYLKALCDIGFNVTLVAEIDQLPGRRLQGWPIPDLGTVEVIVSPEKQQIRQIVDGSSSDTIHVVGGYRGYRLEDLHLNDV